VLIVGALAYGFAVSEGASLVVLLLTAYGIICQLAPPILAAMYWRRATTSGVIAGFVTGSGTAAFFFISGYLGSDLRPYDLHEGMLGLMAHVPVLIAVSLLTQQQEEGHQEAFTQAAA
ncbi:MAG: sodium:solute symporter family protein, partial [Pseudomonadota bacterium]